MTEAEQIAERIRALLPHVKFGSLRFWGDWFGKPYDNVHTISGCFARDDLLIVSFDDSEQLFVWSPQGSTISQNAFRVDTAGHVRWEWYYYGRPKSEENLCFIEYRREGGSIEVTTDPSHDASYSVANLQYPAVEIL